jgi:hypothetical protein
LSDFESGGTFSTIALANLAELNLYALRTDINDGSFMMVNSGIGTPVTFPVQHDRGVLNPIPIEVERIVARVDVSLDPAAIDFTNPLGAGIVPSDLKFVNEFKVMLDNTNKKSFLFADADQKDPNYAEVATASLTNEFFFITSFPTGFNGVDVPVSSGKGTSNYSTPQYCLENTMEQDYTPTPQKYALEDNATCLILRLRVNKGNTFYMKKDGTLVATDPGTDLKYTYTDGYCYYRVYLRRVGLSIPGSISDVPYGIIRNNLYQIDINTIKGVGSHSIASLKHMPIETGNLIDMDINVKPWTIVKDVIDIP